MSMPPLFANNSITRWVIVAYNPLCKQEKEYIFATGFEPKRETVQHPTEAQRQGKDGVSRCTSPPTPKPQIKIEMNEVLEQLQELKQLATIGAKNALNMNDVALLTGLSKSHLYKLVCQHKIPHYKSEGGKLTYFNKQEIEGWLLAHRVPTDAEVEQRAVAYCVSNEKGGAR